MKRGNKVAICHDGKWGRRIKGIVTGTRKGHHIKVMFINSDDKPVEFWVRRRPAIRHRKEVRILASVMESARLTHFKDGPMIQTNGAHGLL